MEPTDEIPESNEVFEQGISDALFEHVRYGLMNVRWDDETGEALFQLTAKGRESAADLIRYLSGEDDHSDGGDHGTY